VTYEEVFAILADPDLFDLLVRLARKYFREEADAEDVRQGAYAVAAELLVEGRPPREGFERGWMCRVLRNHALEKLRERKEEREALGKPVDTTDFPDIPDEDHGELLEHQQKVEQRHAALEKVSELYPKEAAFLRAAYGGKKKRGFAQDAASRKRKERTRTFVASAVAATLAAAAAVVVMFFVMRPKPTVPILPALVWNDTTLASASRELAAKSCAAQEWSACLSHLADAERLDPSHFGATERSAHVAAIVGVRHEALEACGKQRWSACMQGLDESKRYDPAGDNDPLVNLARFEAGAHGAGGFRAPPGEPDAKGPLPY
jgi:DNA-directed RNA polymerase specialized sigma24 family protein